VDVRIGVTHTMREIEIELEDGTDPAALKATIDEALSNEDRVLWLTDKRGRQVGLPVKKVSYVEIGSPTEHRTIGFHSA
jgi:hypothetical protein